MTTRRFWGSDADGGEQRHRRDAVSTRGLVLRRSVRAGWRFGHVVFGFRLVQPVVDLVPVIGWIDADDFRRVGAHIHCTLGPIEPLRDIPGTKAASLLQNPPDMPAVSKGVRRIWRLRYSARIQSPIDRDRCSIR